MFQKYYHNFPKHAARLFMALALCGTSASAQSVNLEFETQARAAVVMDQTTGQILLSKDADLALPPASMSKLMTLNMAFEALRDGRLSLDTVLPVSPHAASYGGSTMFLDPRDRVSVEDLIRGIIVLSGNDACVVLAEALSPDGTEKGFARMMTTRAQELGMTRSTFVNASGWPEPGHVMSMHDLAVLAERLISDFPEFYPYFAQTSFEFDGRAPANTRNRNPLLRLGIGADGLKTGHTQEAGYGLVGSAKQGERRIIFVVTGLPSEAARARESERLTNWAFRQFLLEEVREEGAPITQAEVFMGDVDSVPLVSDAPIALLRPVIGARDISVSLTLDRPLVAPLQKGTKAGTASFQVGTLSAIEVPVYVGADVQAAGLLKRIGVAAKAVLSNLQEE